MGNGINDKTTALEQFKQSTGSFKTIITLAILVATLLGTAITLGITIGTDRSKIHYLDRVHTDLRGDFNDHVKKYEQLDKKVTAIDKNVYGISVKLDIEGAIKPDDINVN